MKYDLKIDRKQSGYVLFVTLVLLLIMTMLALYMFRGFIIDEKLSGNHREKSRSLDVAQAVLNDARVWLAQPGNTYAGNWVTGVVCTGLMSAQSVCDPLIVVDVSEPSSWSSHHNYINAGMIVNSLGGKGRYFSAPIDHIQYLGTTSANPPDAMYLVTAASTGGNNTATSVLQAVYKVIPNTKDLTGG